MSIQGTRAQPPVEQQQNDVSRTQSFVRFILVGGGIALASALALDFLIDVVELDLLRASLIVGACGNLAGFVVHREWTFIARMEHPLKQWLRYTTVTATAIAASSALIWTLCTQAGLSHFLASLCASASFSTINFILHFHWTFSLRKEPETSRWKEAKTHLSFILVTHYYPAHGGGIEIVAAQLAARLAAMGYKGNWFSSATDIPPSIDGVKVHPCAAWNMSERCFGVPFPVWSPASYFQLAVAIYRADVVHVHDCQYPGSQAAALCARIFKKRLVVTQHVGEIPYESATKRMLLAALNHIGAAAVMGYASRVHFVSPIVREYFSARCNNRTSHFVDTPNGVDLNAFSPCSRPEREQTRANVGATESTPMLLFVGRYVEKKGLPLLRALATRRPDWRFVFAGRGPLGPDTWGLPNVTELGHQDQRALIRLYGAADLLLLPSVGEGFPLVIQEALSCGLIAAVAPEVARAGNLPSNLVLTERVDSSQAASRWEEKIHQWLGEELEARNATSLAAREFARQNWSWEAAASAVSDSLAMAESESNAPTGKIA